MSNIKKLIDLFYFDQDTNIPIINNYGVYRAGLTGEEVIIYLTVRAYQNNIKFNDKLMKKYYDIAGANTCAVVDSKVLHYRWDVQRFASQLFNGTATHFD